MASIKAKDFAMDTDQQFVAAQQIDPDQAGQIIRQLGSIAADYHLASGPIADRLMSEISKRQTARMECYTVGPLS